MLLNVRLNLNLSLVITIIILTNKKKPVLKKSLKEKININITSKGEIISNIVHNNIIYIKYVRTRCLYVVIETAGPPSLKSVGNVALKD